MAFPSVSEEKLLIQKSYFSQITWKSYNFIEWRIVLRRSYKWVLKAQKWLHLNNITKKWKHKNPDNMNGWLKKGGPNMSSYSHFLKFGCKHNPHGICAKTWHNKNRYILFQMFGLCQMQNQNGKQEKWEARRRYINKNVVLKGEREDMKTTDMHSTWADILFIFHI